MPKGRLVLHLKLESKEFVAVYGGLDTCLSRLSDLRTLFYLRHDLQNVREGPLWWSFQGFSIYPDGFSIRYH